MDTDLKHWPPPVGKDYLSQYVKLARIFAMPANVEDLAALVSRLERVAVRLEGAAAAGSGSGATAESSSAAVAAFDALLSGPLQQFVSISQQIGTVTGTNGSQVRTVYLSCLPTLKSVSEPCLAAYLLLWHGLQF